MTAVVKLRDGKVYEADVLNTAGGIFTATARRRKTWMVMGTPTVEHGPRIEYHWPAASVEYVRSAP